MLGNFIYSKTKSLFEDYLNNGLVLDEAVVFIEDTKLIWNHGTYFDCSVASDIFNNYKTEISNTYATKASLDNKVDKVSGKQLSSEDFTTALKTRLEGINVYKHAFNALSALPDSGDGWYSIINLGDMESAIVQISAGQSDTQVAVSAGWGGNDIGSLAVLNCTLDVNNNYAHIKAVRIRRHKANNNDANGYLMLEAKLNRTGYTNGYRNTVVSVFTNAGHNPIVIDSNATNVLQLNSSTSEILLQEFELADRTIMAKAIKVETINADNLKTVATTGSYNDLMDTPSIPTETTINDWGFTKNTGDIIAIPTDVIVDEIEPNLVSTAIRKTPLVLTDSEKEIARNNIGAAETNAALRSLFVAAGALYNNTTATILRKAPWGTKETWVKNDDGTYTYTEEPAMVDHLPKHYYLNGLGDITEEQMLEIYSERKNLLYAQAYATSSILNCRTLITKRVGQTSLSLGINLIYLFGGRKDIEVIGDSNTPAIYLTSGGSLVSAWKGCTNLKHISSKNIYVQGANLEGAFKGCASLETVYLRRITTNVSFADSPNLSKNSLKYMIEESKATSTITITLHPDAHARLVDNEEIIAALAAKPLVSLSLPA